MRILWLVLGALLLVSALPIGLYHRQVLQLSQEKLVDTERVQQTELTRSLAQEVQFFEANLTQQLISERQILALTGLIENVEDSVAEPKVTRLLENFVDSNRNTFYLSDGGGARRQRHQCFAGKFSGGTRSVRGQGSATGIRELRAVRKIPQRPSGIGAGTIGRRLLLPCR